MRLKPPQPEDAAKIISFNLLSPVSAETELLPLAVLCLAFAANACGVVQKVLSRVPPILLRYSTFSPDGASDRILTLVQAFRNSSQFSKAFYCRS